MKINQKAIRAYFDAIAETNGGYLAIIERCKAEYSHGIKRKGDINGLASWLQGCAVTELEIYDCAILELAKSWGWKPTAKTPKGIETQEWKIIDSWWNFAAMQIIKGANKDQSTF
jgi:hypothetical protein